MVITPILVDGFWGRLVDIASHYECLGFEVVLVASTADLNRWVEARGTRDLFVRMVYLQITCLKSTS